ncbi:class I adenylate-forming enzyme family protein [Glaciimonas sp. CA11.2]|uniref:class I adenylate-forming enzyme family protein n=1 Tax=unclassified Glaciimonas TaxID=2644401 RepID=UPI002AB4A48E|nr:MULTISPECIES: class I adenylate-forming enzyme family protein [unclassified Glaciimonas]MDY7546886.1 class I adenylate-forming enzyme family protein [Glaciimonas sp. CA11.2]MEB0012355.1 class I adenylate-forming enzyme family protein [Glaciimonas sp. Cout2]MEB0080459.1 class I adenylate-forming enzyme family protein [Glaciimonas sp. Gout2]MEB0161928.1 class I adenylate-forming enzyme family protein [Glaciimonas sp. CA11.2]
MKQWDDTWPATRLETHFDGRVVRCFVERPKSVYAMLDDAVQRNPNGDAMVCGADRITWKGLRDSSARLATGLASRGIGVGDRVAMLIGNRNEFVISLFAIARLGAIAVPLSIREQTPGLAYMLNDCSASLIVHDAELGERLPVSADVPSLKTRVSIGHCSGSEEFASLMTASSKELPAKVNEEDVVAILYTSGTTGKPKGAALTHLGVVHSGMHLQTAMGLTIYDTAVASVPLSHVTGLIALVATMVRCAGKLVIMPSFRATDFLALAARERMTYTLMVPAMYNLCLLQPDFERHDISSWRVGGYGGAPMPVATISSLAQKIPSLTLMNCYGSTETTSPSTLMPQGETAAHNDTVGRALACVEMAIFDESGCEVEPGVLGEIWIKGPMVVKGYWNNPSATADNFTGGFWHSGDIGSIGSDGYIKVADRMKDMINRGGYKIYTIEVENVLYQHPAVLECAVVAKPCPVLGERVHAFVTLRQPDTLADGLLQALTTYCAERLSDYKVPESFTLSESPLPRNANGKLLKRALRDQASALLPTPKAHQ